MLADGYGRTVSYLRVSVTDRCDLRCAYCMPDGIELRPREEILSYEEIERFVQIAVDEGVTHVRLTGGEPLVRKGIVGHAARLAQIPGLEGLAITTNGTHLADMAEALVDAGVERVNVSLDSLDADVFERVTGGGRLADVLEGIDTALDAGLDPVKINVVAARSLSQDLGAFALLTAERPVHVRFIEYMTLGSPPLIGPGVREEPIPAAEILARLRVLGPELGLGALEPAESPGGWGPARYHRFEHATGTLGVITPLSEHFCGTCDRLRLTADGRLRVCLFSDDEIDVRGALRAGTDEDVRSAIREAVAARPEGHGARAGTLRSMSEIGG
jgi:cyclic pyranopterin phosphate synthase